MVRDLRLIASVPLGALLSALTDHAKRPTELIRDIDPDVRNNVAGSGLPGIFKTAALALIGDIVSSTTEHTSIMNTVEGFFGIGSIIGPALLARLLRRGFSWQWLYVIAGTMCVLLIVTAASARYPAAKRTEIQKSDTTAAITNRYVLAFSLGAFLYVAIESAVYVWMPTMVAGYRGSAVWIAAYGISTGFAAVLFIGLTLNWVFNPAHRVFREADETEYSFTEGVPNVRS